MSRRFEVLVEVEEFREVQRSARRARMSVAEWVRSALRAGLEAAATNATSRKLEVVRAAACHSFPAGEIGAMLAEIESGQGLKGET